MTLLAEEANTVAGELEVQRAADLTLARVMFRRAEGSRSPRDPFDSHANNLWSHATPYGWQAYARSILWAIAAQPDTGIDYERANRYYRVLEKFMRPDTIYPFLSPDYEGGLTIEWSAGEWLLEIDLEEGGEYFLMHTDYKGSERIRERGRVRELPTERFIPLLADFSEYVAEMNPEWRRHFV